MGLLVQTQTFRLSKSLPCVSEKDNGTCCSEPSWVSRDGAVGLRTMCERGASLMAMRLFCGYSLKST